MLLPALQILAYLTVPLAALELARRYRFFEWLNPVVFCYLAGMLVANTPIVELDAQTAKLATEASIPLAIPLVLFSSDVRAWLSQSRATVVSFLCATTAVCVASFAAAQYLSHLTPEYWKVSGMLVGVYTGGTPNLLSIGMALEATEETFVLLNASDVIVGGIYLIFLLTLAKPLLKRFFPAFEQLADPEAVEAAEEPKGDFDWRAAAPHMAIGFGLSVGILAVSAGLTWAIAGELMVAGIFLGITTGGIVGSLTEKIRNLRGSYELGNYLILVFCVAMGTRTDFSELVSAGSALLIYTAVVIVGAIALHFLLASIFRIDIDTLLITSTAAVYGPAFVGPIAEAIDNRQVILSGLTAGLVGYAVGNYLGMALAYMLQP